MGNGLWTLREGKFKVTGPADSLLWLTNLLDRKGEAVLRENWNGSSAPTTLLRDATLSLALASADTIASIIATIKATAGFGVTEDDIIQFNGNQTAITHGSTITIDAGHNLAAKLSAAEAAGLKYKIPLQAYVAGGTFTTRKIVWVDVVATGATTIVISMPRTTSYRATAESDLVFDVKDNDQGGTVLHSYFNLDWAVRAYALSATATEVKYFYWEPVLRDASETRFLSLDVQTSANNNYKVLDKGTANYVAKTSSSVAYIGERVSVGIDPKNGNAEFGLMRYDGISVKTAGMPTPNMTVSVIAGAGLGTGRYKYLAQYKRTDRFGNVTYGNPTLINGEQIVTTTAGNNRVTVAFTNLDPVTYPSLDIRANVANAVGFNMTTGAPTRQFNLTAASYTTNSNIRPGEMVCYRDTVSGEIKTRRTSTCTPSYLNLLFDASEPTETVAGSGDINNGIVLQIFRTKVDGQTYYLQSEQLVLSQTQVISITDSSADTALGIEWDGPFLGQERRDPPPPLPILETHQGLLVGGGYGGAPNQIAWNSQFGAEYFPKGTNTSIVLSGKVGAIKALASADGDSLVCFKDDAFAVVTGDFYSGVVFPAMESEGDLGCPGPKGWVKARDAIFFFSKKGFRVYAGGKTDTLDDRLKGFLNSIPDGPRPNGTRVRWEHLAMAHDIDNQRIYCYVPLTTPGSGDQEALWEEYLFSYDYAGDFVNTIGHNINSLGGLEYYGDTLWRNEVKVETTSRASQSGAFKNAASSVAMLTTGNQGNSILETQWEFLGEPSFLKDFMQAKLWRRSDFAALTFSVSPYYGFNKPSNLPTPIAVTIPTDKQGGIAILTKRNAESISMEIVTTPSRLPLKDKAAVQSPDTNTSGVFDLIGYELVVNVPFKKERVDQTIS